MRPGDKCDHPEVIEFAHICAVSPDADGAKEICELLKTTTVTVTKSKTKKKKINKDKILDKELKDTFPASDPITHY
ncbi:hypothetical protein [Legionella sp. km772]|uniref:hypothetical protein n=1 Tax=Legionella sp. km772 TaxID=2498111 RepID=UPI000F8CB40F|nr:hypothetical protein [Legionella sp. km772]RUR13367.1 hypothetical protein ELY15_02690 [Legionella sp. km772]